jgi:hypothetical protein
MRSIGEKIEEAIFTTKPANQDTYGFPQVFLQINRGVVTSVWRNVGMHVDEDREESRHQWYETH